MIPETADPGPSHIFVIPNHSFPLCHSETLLPALSFRTALAVRNLLSSADGQTSRIDCHSHNPNPISS